MPPASSTTEQAFLEDLDKKLWNAADRLRSNLDAAVYKHAVLGLIFVEHEPGTARTQRGGKMRPERCESGSKTTRPGRIAALVRAISG